ncbi:MAG: hypothetical protein ACRDZ8_09430, partial [Acidimicrobiales bacterium]
PAQMTAEQLEAGLWQAYHDFYACRPRLRRWRRHVGMGLRMTVGGVITKTNMDFAKQYRPGRDERPRYEADPADIKTLLVTSQAPASDAIITAVSLLPAKQGPRITSGPAPGRTLISVAVKGSGTAAVTVAAPEAPAAQPVPVETAPAG